MKIILAGLLLFITCAVSRAEFNNLLSGKEMNKNKEEFVPQWAKEVVWYQIFPERFRNGDPSNDPTIDDIKGADPIDIQPKYFETHPWGSDWYKLQDYEKKNGEKEMWIHLLRRRYGGDLQGVIDKLDYLKDLGIGAIYFNPVFDSPSLHKYDGASYHHIDPNFGPDPKGDRELIKTEIFDDPSTWVWTSADKLALKLIEEIHKRGMKVIFDGVFNHLGYNNVAFQDVKKNQEKSKYKNWFDIISWENKEKGTEFSYKGFFGVKSLPELKEDSEGIVEGPRNYIFAALERWLNPKKKGIEFGIDGWRLDVAFLVGHPFWKKFREHVKSINPEAYITGELFLKPEAAGKYFNGDELDAEMNYNFAFACDDFFFNPYKVLSASRFDKQLEYLRTLYPQGVAYVMQNLFGSHDNNRIASHILNRGIGRLGDHGKYFELSKALNNPNYKVNKPGEEEIKLQKLFLAMQMTYVGAPMVYYGDEVGMWGSNDPDCRKPMVWDDIKYKDETAMPDGGLRNPDKVGVNSDLFNYYKKLIKIRNENEVLKTGSYKTLIADDDKEIFAFKRFSDQKNIVVVLNNSESTQSVNLEAADNMKFTDQLSGKVYTSEEGLIEIILPPKTALILK